MAAPGHAVIFLNALCGLGAVPALWVAGLVSCLCTRSWLGRRRDAGPGLRYIGLEIPLFYGDSDQILPDLGHQRTEFIPAGSGSPTVSQLAAGRPLSGWGEQSGCL